MVRRYGLVTFNPDMDHIIQIFWKRHIFVAEEVWKDPQYVIRVSSGTHRKPVPSNRDLIVSMPRPINSINHLPPRS